LDSQTKYSYGGMDKKHFTEHDMKRWQGALGTNMLNHVMPNKPGLIHTPHVKQCMAMAFQNSKPNNSS
jgi:hypothetical protein